MHWSKGPNAEEIKERMRVRRSSETIEKLRRREFTSEWREKLRKASTGHIHSDEQKDKISQSLKGKVGPNLGRKFSEETCSKISASLKKRTVSLEHREAISRAQKGHLPREGSQRGRDSYYTRLDGEIVHLDSSYELEIVKYLDNIGESWICVNRSFEHSLLLSTGQRYYPDFYLPRLGFYIDPKGFDRDPVKRQLVETEYSGRVRFLIGNTYLDQLREVLK